MLYITSVLLQKQSGGQVITTHTLSWRVASSEDEAKGHAVSYALNSKPGFAVVSVICNQIPQPLSEAIEVTGESDEGSRS